jgi:acyl carrier protein
MSDETVARVLQVFREALRVEVTAPDTDVIAAGLLDSLALVTLVSELEERCSISIAFEFLEVDDFRTPESIARVVKDSA